jgi:hypothetical protein
MIEEHTDHLELAKEKLQWIEDSEKLDGSWLTDDDLSMLNTEINTETQLAIAHALVALVERLDKAPPSC